MWLTREPSSVMLGEIMLAIHDRSPRAWRAQARTVLSMVAAVSIIVTVLPKVAGASWAQIGPMLRALTVGQILLLTALWFVGLYAYSFVQTASLPRLSKRQALTMNLSGSAVANLVPFGGALGIGVNYAMVRSWGMGKTAFTLSALVTNIWNILTKLSLPIIALGVIVIGGQVTDRRLVVPAVVAATVLVMVTGAMAAALTSVAAARLLGRWAERTANGALRMVRSDRRVRWERRAVGLRLRTVDLLRTAWAQMSLGMLVYAALQSLLLWATLHMLGSHLPPSVVFAGYALERLLTLVVLTPGGAGFAEVGTTALLIAFGGAPAVTAAGVLVYRGFTFLIEIPVGGAVLLGWLWRRRRNNRTEQTPALAGGAA